MRWFRSNRILGAQAALFALLVQFTLAFGHIHVGQANAAARAAVTLANDGLGTPAVPDQDHHANDVCAICATIHMTGSALAAASPDLPLPIIFRTIASSFSSQIVRDDLRCFELRSRRPPQA
jgi:hypothetical protein